MRHGRAKAARRTLQFYQRSIGLQPPYHVLLDGTFVMACVKFNLISELKLRMTKLLQVKSESFLRLVTTQSVIDEIDQLLESVNGSEKSQKRRRLDAGPDDAGCDSPHKEPQSPIYASLQTAKLFILHHCQTVSCKRVDPSMSESECKPVGSGSNKKRSRSDKDVTSSNSQQLESLSAAGRDIYDLVTSPEPSANRAIYIIATQDETLQDTLRNVGSRGSTLGAGDRGSCASLLGVPLVRLATRCGCVLLLEPPSSSATYNASQQEQQKWKASTKPVADDRQEPSSTLVQRSIMEQERILAAHVRRENLHQSQGNAHRPPPIRRNPKAKGPNPLSVKKKRPSTAFTRHPSGGKSPQI
jgi:rRNA-processing protein FCF1